MEVKTNSESREENMALKDLLTGKTIINVISMPISTLKDNLPIESIKIFFSDHTSFKVDVNDDTYLQFHFLRHNDMQRTVSLNQLVESSAQRQQLATVFAQIGYDVTLPSGRSLCAELDRYEKEIKDLIKRLA